MLDSVFKLRHAVFFERLGWDVRSVCGREIDDFDTPEAIYGVALDESGTMEGCFRLLPTTGPYMLKDVFAELLHGQPAPRGETVLESSRFSVLPAEWHYNAKQALFTVTGRLLMSQITYCLEHGIDTVVSVTDVRFERVLKAVGLSFERYGPPIRIGKSLAVAGWQHPTEENLKQVEEAYLKNLSLDQAGLRKSA
ncbi:MAG: hypothetical protein A2516_02100 [Alphaproteobacteria bacterium RIFOXYD12_FULL_60_8]|nr:MAG: hypothetical protein A2516_02100 [Alphaproteobacteria bacterium RIFOXYD12_FULL_60_8]